MPKLILIRHGNTFDKGDTLLRVGCRTNLPLSSSGQEQAHHIGHYLQSHYPRITQAFCSELMRTEETATIALSYIKVPPPLSPLKWLNEIDYGIDDGKPEADVIKRLGEKAIQDFETQRIMPKEWSLDIELLEAEINKLVRNIETQAPDSVYLVVTSNGIARYFLSLLPPQTNTIIQTEKMPTGSLSVFNFHGQQWHCEHWGMRPAIAAY